MTDLLPLLYSFIDKFREGFPVDEFAVPLRHLQPSILIHHFAPGDGDHRDTVALHALEDVVVDSLVMRLG